MKGVTLIETLIYLALLSLLFVGIFSSAYMMINLKQREGNSLKIDNEMILKTYY